MRRFDHLRDLTRLRLFAVPGLDVFVGLDKCVSFDGDAVDLGLIRRRWIQRPEA